MSVTKDAPRHVKDDIHTLWCDLMDAGIGAVMDYHDDGGFDIVFSDETQEYFDLRENSCGFDEDGNLIPAENFDEDDEDDEQAATDTTIEKDAT